jgi:hypothetical protein
LFKTAVDGRIKEISDVKSFSYIPFMTGKNFEKSIFWTITHRDPLNLEVYRNSQRFEKIKICLTKKNAIINYSDLTALTSV